MILSNSLEPAVTASLRENVVVVLYAGQEKVRGAKANPWLATERAATVRIEIFIVFMDCNRCFAPKGI